MSNASTINVHFPLNSLLPFSLLSFLMSGPFFCISSGATESIHIQPAINILHIASLPEKRLLMKWWARPLWRTGKQAKWGAGWYQGLGIIKSTVILKKFKCFHFMAKVKHTRESRRRCKRINSPFSCLCMSLLFPRHVGFHQRRVCTVPCQPISNEFLVSN